MMQAYIPDLAQHMELPIVFLSVFEHASQEFLVCHLSEALESPCIASPVPS